MIAPCGQILVCINTIQNNLKNFILRIIAPNIPHKNTNFQIRSFPVPIGKSLRESLLQIQKYILSYKTKTKCNG